jgi:hypothetical protein
MTRLAIRAIALAAALGLAAAMFAWPVLAQQQPQSAPDAQADFEDPDAREYPPDERYPPDAREDFEDLARQEPEDIYEPPPPPHAPEQVSEAKLNQFVVALAEVQEIRAEAIDDLETATEPYVAKEVEQEARERMFEAVEDAGLTIEEYNQIAALMGTDPELRERVQAKLDQLEERS